MRFPILIFLITYKAVFLLSDNNINTDERIDNVCEGISLIQKKNGFAYGTDAVLLAAFVRKMGKKSSAAELGAGSGIISLLCEKYEKFGKIFSVEIQDEYYDLLQRNVRYNKSNIIPVKSDVRYLKTSDFGFEFDAVFSNPPYMKTDSGKANRDLGKNSSRHEVNGDIDAFCKSASCLLKHGGLFYCVYRPDRTVDLISGMRKYGLEPKRMTIVYPYENSRPSLILVEAKKGASSSLFLTKPFVIYNKITAANDDITSDMKKVYTECDMDNEYKLL